MKAYIILLHFEIYSHLCVKMVRDCPKERGGGMAGGGGVHPVRAMLGF